MRSGVGHMACIDRFGAGRGRRPSFCLAPKVWVGPGCRSRVEQLRFAGLLRLVRRGRRKKNV